MFPLIKLLGEVFTLAVFFAVRPAPPHSAPGSRDREATFALAIVYAALPCLLKLGALAALFSYSATSRHAA